MADSSGRTTDALNRLRALAERASDVDFFQALRRIEVAFGDKPRLGTAARPTDEPVRIGQEPTVAFAPATLASIQMDDPTKPIALTVLFQGLFGPSGPLPLHLTEYARNRVRHHGDNTLVQFANVFHHRLLMLFYRAWAQAQPTVSADRPSDDRFATYVGAIFGGADPTTRGRDSLPDSLKLSYAGLLALQSKPRDALRSMVQDLLGVRTEIEEYVGEWVSLPDRSRWKLGRTTQPGILGASATLGGRAWMCQHKFRVVLGPLTDAERETLRPGTTKFHQLCDIVRSYVGDELRWDVKLLVRDAEMLRLGRSGHLGWSAFLGPAGRGSTDADVIVEPQGRNAAVPTPRSGVA